MKWFLECLISMYLCIYVCMLASLALYRLDGIISIHVRYLRLIHHRSVPSECQHYRPQNMGSFTYVPKHKILYFLENVSNDSV
jgi:hypothetical protein